MEDVVKMIEDARRLTLRWAEGGAPITWEKTIEVASWWAAPAHTEQDGGEPESPQTSAALVEFSAGLKAEHRRKLWYCLSLHEPQLAAVLREAEEWGGEE
jgi:hypothetical protein